LDVANDQQAYENGFFEEVEVDGYKFKMIHSPVTFSETPGTIRTLAPELGQDTETVLMDYGYSWDDLSAMKEQGVII
jgi:crotonobetainyl-CoA:carnitine CoA-transferase CaiB-like acyl-CoA transferase